MGEHFVAVCEFGARHGQCRCRDPNKTVRRGQAELNANLV
jgi:hypothetical protein